MSIPFHRYFESQQNWYQTLCPAKMTFLPKENDCINVDTKPGSDCKSQWAENRLFFESKMSYFPNVEAPFLAMSLHLLLTPLTRVYVKTGTLKPGALSIPNLPTYPSVETRIGAAASVSAMVLLWCVSVSTLQHHSKNVLAQHAHRIGLAYTFSNHRQISSETHRIDNNQCNT